MVFKWHEHVELCWLDEIERLSLAAQKPLHTESSEPHLHAMQSVSVPAAAAAAG